MSIELYRRTALAVAARPEAVVSSRPIRDSPLHNGNAWVSWRRRVVTVALDHAENLAG
jgi:hypothetical protein